MKFSNIYFVMENSSQNYFLFPSYLSIALIQFINGCLDIVKLITFKTIPQFLPLIVNEFMNDKFQINVWDLDY